MTTRRDFLKYAALAGFGLAIPTKWLATPSLVYAFSQSKSLKKFIQPMRGVGGDGIPLAVPDTAAQPWWQPGVTHYTIDIEQYEDQLHPDLPNATRLWGYGQNGNHKHLGGIIAAKRGTPVQLTFRNNLPPDHILPVDDSVMGVMGNQNNRANVHLHGGFVPWVSDGGPHAWFDPDGHRGPSFVNALNPNLAANEAEYYYPNKQSSRLMWYHDHTFGTTRLNAYAGVASAYVIYDDYELDLVKHHHIPGPLDARTIYMVFQDKIFVSEDIGSIDPSWTGIMPNTRPGDLWYPHEYEPSRWDVGTNNPLSMPNISCVPEFFGDTILVNGTVYPYMEVEQRQYRIRMLNACGARFLNPRLVYADGTDFPDNTEPGKRMGPPFIQIGTEGGFLPAPVLVNFPKTPQLTLAPAERADLIVDFRFVPDGATLLLYNDSPAPNPMGEDLNDYFTGNPLNPTITQPGYGPNTRTLMQFRVKKRVGAPDRPTILPRTFSPTDAFLIGQNPRKPTSNPRGVKVRYVTLNETFDEFGRLIQMLGTGDAYEPMSNDPTNISYGFARPYMADPTEVIPEGTKEIWEIINLTGDTHPVHFHLVNVQLLARQPFDEENYNGGKPSYTGKAIAPDVNELGWKETVRVRPNEVARVLMQFKLPKVPFNVPDSPRTGGAEYVWHCHILEHEEHDMMRPLVITHK